MILSHQLPPMSKVYKHDQPTGSKTTWDEPERRYTREPLTNVRTEILSLEEQLISIQIKMIEDPNINSVLLEYMPEFANNLYQVIWKNLNNKNTTFFTNNIDALRKYYQFLQKYKVNLLKLSETTANQQTFSRYQVNNINYLYNNLPTILSQYDKPASRTTTHTATPVHIYVQLAKLNMLYNIISSKQFSQINFFQQMQLLSNATQLLVDILKHTNNKILNTNKTFVTYCYNLLTEMISLQKQNTKQQVNMSLIQRDQQTICENKLTEAKELLQLLNQAENKRPRTSQQHETKKISVLEKQFLAIQILMLHTDKNQALLATTNFTNNLFNAIQIALETGNTAFFTNNIPELTKYHNFLKENTQDLIAIFTPLTSEPDTGQKATQMLTNIEYLNKELPNILSRYSGQQQTPYNATNTKPNGDFNFTRGRPRPPQRPPTAARDNTGTRDSFEFPNEKKPQRSSTNSTDINTQLTTLNNLYNSITSKEFKYKQLSEQKTLLGKATQQLLNILTYQTNNHSDYQAVQNNQKLITGCHELLTSMLRCQDKETEAIKIHSLNMQQQYGRDEYNAWIKRLTKASELLPNIFIKNTSETKRRKI